MKVSITKKELKLGRVSKSLFDTEGIPLPSNKTAKASTNKCPKPILRYIEAYVSKHAITGLGSIV